MTRTPAAFRLLGRRMLTPDEERRVADACRQVIGRYRKAVRSGRTAPARLRLLARRALLHLGGDPERSTVSLKDYDHRAFGPFLGVSDEGSAAPAIVRAGHESPKARALAKAGRLTPLAIGLSVDAERLAGVGEVVVGPDEYADIWLASVDRSMVTTNVGTRVNMRTFRREPRVVLWKTGRADVARAEQEIARHFKPFVETPDGEPRPLTVLVEFPRTLKATAAARRTVLRRLNKFVSSGRAAGGSHKRAPRGQALGLEAWTAMGLRGKADAEAAIDLAASAGISLVVISGLRKSGAEEAAGLRDYFEPGIVGPLLRRAKKKNVRIRPAGLPDTDTIARSVWVSLATARAMGVNLGKYGCFPLTERETDAVVSQVQEWMPEWSAAPVFFVDEGLLRDDGVDVGNDLVRGVVRWLDLVASHGVQVVLIDTVHKSSGRRLLKATREDTSGFLTEAQIERVERHAKKRRVRVLWAGGLQLRDGFKMGRLGVFGVYITSAAATTIPVAGSYVRDPALAGLKEPSFDAVLRAKVLIEAGFLSSRLSAHDAAKVTAAAHALLAELDKGKEATPRAVAAATRKAADACRLAWPRHWAR